MALLFGAFGLWPLVAPNSYLRLVKTINHERMRLPGEGFVRIVGGLLLVAGAAILFAPRIWA